MIQFWRDLLDSLDSTGGHICLLMGLLMFGALGEHYNLPKADDIFIGSFTALMVYLKTTISNQARINGGNKPDGQVDSKTKE